MLTDRVINQPAAALVAPMVYKKVAAKHSLSTSDLRTLLAISVLTESYSDSISVAELAATNLFGRTRQRAQVSVLVQSGCITRRRRQRRYMLRMTTKGKQIVRDYTVATYQAVSALLNP